MKGIHLMILGAALVPMSLSLVSDVSAGGGGVASCGTGSTSGSTKIVGTLSVSATLNINTNQYDEADFLFRLEKGGVAKFFRVHIPSFPLNGLSAEEVVCVPLTSSILEAGTMVQNILTDFAPGKAALRITDRSVSSAEPLTTAVVVPNLATHAVTMMDVVLYAQ